MFRALLIIFGILIGLIILIAAIAWVYLKPNESILDFIERNPNKSAITLIVNDTTYASFNENKKMPLASTVKTIIAIEYAAQSAAEKINPNERINLDELELFHVKNSDGGAHPAWLNSVKNRIENDSIAIREIAKGMIRYSSNANTEWLSKKLGLKNINNRLDSLGIKNHDEIYYLVSSLYVGDEKFPNLKTKEKFNKIRAMSTEDYIATTNVIHEKLLTDTSYKKEDNAPLKIQRIWSDRLPGSTTKEYAGLMKKLNSKKYFSKKTYEYLDEVMEGIMENKKNQEWLKHAGRKGGSTAFVLTEANYATTKKGDKIELAYFFNDLNIIESMKLQKAMNKFELNILSKKEFREEVREKISGMKN